MKIEVANLNVWKHEQRATLSAVMAERDGAWYAALLASNPKIARRFDDHELVAEKLAASNQKDALANICVSGLLDAESTKPYRQAYKRLTAQ